GSARVVSDPPLLGGPAAVVGQGGDVLDGLDGQARGLQRGDGALAAAAGALDLDLDLLDAVLGGGGGGGLGPPLGGEGGTLARPLEADGPARGPAERVAVGVGDRHRRVVERRLDVHDGPADVAPRLPLLGLGHGSASPWVEPIAGTWLVLSWWVD